MCISSSILLVTFVNLTVSVCMYLSVTYADSGPGSTILTSCYFDFGLDGCIYLILVVVGAYTILTYAT